MPPLAPAQVGTVVAGLAVASVALHLRGRSAPRALLLGLGLGGLVFQVLHTLEHALQLAVWARDPSQPPWLTPWAAALRDGLSADAPAVGTELLHLVGNLLFLVGLLALVQARARDGAQVVRPPRLRFAVEVQLLHVVEHVALTTSTLLLGRALGVTTVFGLLPDGPPTSSTRVVAHFAINAVATGALLTALGGLELRRRRAAPRGAGPARRVRSAGRG